MYDLKRYQIRTGKSNEQQMVKRIVEKYRREVKAPGMADYKGPYTYRAYEMFLYGKCDFELTVQHERYFVSIDQLRHLSKSNEKKIAFLDKVKHGFQ